MLFLIVSLNIAWPQTASGHGSGSPAAPRKTQAFDPSESGVINGGTYRNSAFGFSCSVPPGWVLRTDEMKPPDSEVAGTATKRSDDGGGHVLLAVFSRPPEARGEDVNSSILIAAESTAAYPGLKDAAQYFGPVTEIAKAQGFDVDEDPYEFSVGTKKLIRGDYEKDIGSRVMRQATLVMLSRGYALSFTFIGGTEDEVQELIANLHFTPSAKVLK